MPTIEIASFNSIGLGLNQADFDVAIIEDNKLESHRGLFNELLRQQNGVIVHIGNPDFKDDKEGGFFAGQIIDWDFEPKEIFFPEFDENDPTENRGANQQFKFKFLNNYKTDIDNLLKIALDNSPIKKVCFLTDYQFGPEEGKTEIIYTITDFWKEHDNEGLELNTLYEMYGK
ncbi:hypothetical protein [Flavobacterium tibetense]|uniref:Uncharacterized protein n=1 Tax=Flavobacterium tibetense TaxID=2233533 RepID=A0A365P1I7_9FLAO|nr:hypothetical protein [Flavobacterium tibetense]RBA28340.1 hypothetical protein DPN68_07885 [Flavobacterium tibetense]